MRRVIAMLLFAVLAVALAPSQTKAPVASKLAAAVPTPSAVGQPWVGLWWTETNCPPCTGISFNVYRGSATGVCNFVNGVPPTPYATTSTLPTSTNPFVDGGVTRGQSYVYAVSAVQGGESACSSEVQLTVPSAPPSPAVPQGQTH
jgi:hypothetical protein